MPTDVEIKEEMLKVMDGKEHFEDAIKEMDIFASKEGLDGKSILQKLYSQWKSGKQGHKNLHNSWAAFLLGLTTAKPVGEFAFKVRRAFARPSPPDIDSDFDYLRRDEVMEYIVNKYGRNRVGNIGTYGALKMKSALTRIIKALDIANAYHLGSAEYTTKNVEKVNEIIGSLPRQHGAVLMVKDDDGEHAIKTTADAVKHCRDFAFYMEKHPEIMQHTSNIEGLLSIFGVHASGVVLSDIPLDQIAPLRTAKETSGTVSLATQFAYEDLEKLGLIKFDVLAISTLTVIAETVRLVKENYGIDLDIENLPLDDNKTLELYRTGNLTGVFQCESDKMQETCMEIGVDRFEDIMAAISLFRPGPMDSIPDYCARKRGDQPVSYFHPTITPHVKPYLEKTYGLLVYQEQIMQICAALAGMTISQGYEVIKGIAKKKEDIIKKFRGLFVDGSHLKGVPKEVVEQYWDKFIVPFAAYGFNAAHSCCYAYISYITAYLKAHFPEEFICSYLNIEIVRRNHERIGDLEREAQRMKIKLLPRDINKCTLKYEIVSKKGDGVIQSEFRPPIHCKGLPEAAAANIVLNRPYNSIHDLASRTDFSLVDTESVGALCDAGFFKTKKVEILRDFTIIRDDLKRLRKLGRESQDMFE